MLESERSTMTTDYEIIMAMSTHGGGFVKALAAAALIADARNLGRIKTAFPDYWRDYEIFAEHLKGKAT